jgi:hypothetical protein
MAKAHMAFGQASEKRGIQILQDSFQILTCILHVKSNPIFFTNTKIYISFMIA